MTVTFHYSEDELRRAGSVYLSLYRHQPESGAWQPLPGRMDTEQGTVTTLLDHFSLYGMGPSFRIYFPLIMDNWPPTLPVTKTASVDNAGAGESITYTVTISNPTDTSLTKAITVTDLLPEGFSYGGAWWTSGQLSGGTIYTDGQALTWTGMTLAAHQTGALHYTAGVGADSSPLSCNRAIVDPEFEDFIASSAHHCLRVRKPWWDKSYLYRQPLLVHAYQTITATGDLTVTVPLGLVFDTESLIEQDKMLPDGDDLRVVFWGDSGWQELPREIQGVDSVTSTVWFPLQETIPAGMNGDYYLYYGHHWAEAPASTVSDVFGSSSLLVAHLNGETTGSLGQGGVIAGSGFSWVEEESGYRPAFITGTATLSYTHTGNIYPHTGSVALHVKPSWWASDGAAHYFLQAGQTAQDHLSLYKSDDQQNPELRFELAAGAQTFTVACSAGFMPAGGWNALVATWQDDGGQAKLYANGQASASTTVTSTVSGPLDIWLGSKAGGGSAAEAALSNLMIYSQPMSQEQALSQYRASIWTDVQPQDEEQYLVESVTIDYGYDPLYRLTSADYSSGQSYSYTYDPVGNRLTMSSPQGSATYAYDAANRLTNVNGVQYTWDAKGNLLSDGVRSYTYDHANRLMQVVSGTLTTQYSYNGDGVRIGKTVDGLATQYLVDLVATLPVVISDTEAIYLYGLDIIAQQQAQRYYYVHDGLGSVRQLATESGEIADTLAYDPFGVPLEGDTVYNPFRYTGEAWDAEVELLYLRARYYQPATGRFLTRDPWPGNRFRPRTLNGYPYVASNPVNHADPMGLNGWGPGGICPECGELRSSAELPPEPAEMALILWVPHEIFTRGPDLQVVQAEMRNYRQYGYSRRAALSQAEWMVLAWFFPLGPEHQWFGPERSLTQDVKHDPAIAWFKADWARNGYRVPFTLRHERDPRSGTWLARVVGWSIFARENWELAMCVVGRGSETPEEPIDVVGGVLGSLDLIEVKPAGIGMVRFEVHNTMDRRSLTREPGTRGWLFEPVERRWLNVLGGQWWGTTVYQHFYWYAPHPLGPRGTRNLL